MHYCVIRFYRTLNIKHNGTRQTRMHKIRINEIRFLAKIYRPRIELIQFAYD